MLARSRPAWAGDINAGPAVQLRRGSVGHRCCRRRTLCRRARSVRVSALILPPELAAAQPIVDAFAASDDQLRLLAHSLAEALNPSSAAQLLQSSLREASGRAASAASGANSATLGAFSGVISSLSGAVESSQRLFGALSTAGGIEGQAAVLRTSATLVMDQLSRDGPSRAQLVDSLPYLLPLTAAAFVVPSLASGGSSSSRSGASGGFSRGGSSSIPEEMVLLTYDPDVYLRFFLRRPVFALWRGLRVGTLGGSFALTLWLDSVLGRREENEEAQARRLVDVLAALGPTWVKIGQVLSARVDLLPDTYIRVLKTLQDKVPPFPEPIAKEILARELPRGAFRQVSPQPVSSASLGQVYRATLAADGREVAVKVQRPDVAEAIALDLLILRVVAAVVKKAKSLNSDLVGLVDEWGKRFVDELDYTKEAASGSQFSEAMRKRGLDRVMAAEVVSELTTRRVLTTEWVEGRRIDDPALGAESVDLSVQLAVAAYLTMLLDTGELHADPHPGNLLITPDGKLCILDFGLVTSVTRAQQYAILQYVAHLVGRDYASVPGDLVAMGFVPDAKRQALEDSGVVQVLADVFRALAKGGGVKVVSNNLSKIGKDGDGAAAEAAEEPPPLTSTGLPRERTTKVGTLARDISYIQRKYDNILQIPTYFAYILRSFSVLEGIGLSADPQYSIANACYPYVARRLLTDRSPEARSALEGILYGPAGPEAPLDAKRVAQIATAFSTYTAVTASSNGAGEAVKLGTTEREALRLLFSPDGGPMQDIVTREVARLAASAAAVSADSLGATAAGRLVLNAVRQQQEAFAAALGGSGNAAAVSAGLPAEVVRTASIIFRKTHADELQLEAAATIAGALFGGAAGAQGRDGAGATGSGAGGEKSAEARREEAQALLRRGAEAVTAAAPMLPELAPGIAAAGLRLGAQLLQQAAQRLSRAGAEEAGAAAAARGEQSAPSAAAGPAAAPTAR